MTGIQWTDETWNPVAGCTPVSAGCANCYAVQVTRRLGGMAEADERAGRDPGRKAAYRSLTVLQPNGRRHFTGEVRTIEAALRVPFGWRKPRRVFVNSTSDLFHEGVPFEFIDRVFAVMALCPRHTFQLLTKRPERMAEYFEDDIQRCDSITLGMREFDGSMPDLPDWPLPNVWIGTSVEDQAAAQARIPHLLRCPAAVRFLSCEPLLGAVDLGPWITPVYDNTAEGGFRGYHFPGDDIRTHGKELAVGWVIVGGESGPRARPCDVAWIRSIVEQCRASSVACYVKQLGAKVDHTDPALRCGGLRDPKGGDPGEWPEALRVREFPRASEVRA